MNCQMCGERNPEFGFTEITGYDWDSDDEMATSVSQVLGHRCASRPDCARRVIASGYSIEALHEIAYDRENLGELADQARQVIHELAEAYREIARGEDMAARENGYGAIGI